MNAQDTQSSLVVCDLLVQEVGILGADPEAVIDKAREERGLPKGRAEREAAGFSFLDTHGAVTDPKILKNRSRRHRPKTAAREFVRFTKLLVRDGCLNKCFACSLSLFDQRVPTSLLFEYSVVALIVCLTCSLTLSIYWLFSPPELGWMPRCKCC